MDFTFYLNLCSTMYCVNSYVLLTANIDEFKDLARKIVPGRFADELTNVFLKRLIESNPRYKDKTSGTILPDWNMQAKRSSEERLDNKARRYAKENTYRPYTNEFTSRKPREDFQLRAEERNNGMDIEAIAQRVSELLINKYHIKLETMANNEKRIERTDDIQELSRNYDPVNKVTKTNTLQRETVKSVTEPLRYQGLMPKTKPKTEYGPKTVYRPNHLNRGSDSNEVSYTKTFSKVAPLMQYSMDNNKYRATKTKDMRTTRKLTPIENLHKEYEDMYSGEHNEKQEKLQTSVSQSTSNKKKYNQLHVISEYVKNDYRASDTTTTQTVQTSKANSQEYEIEYEYYEDDTNNNKGQTQNTPEPTKKVVVELQKRPTNYQNNNEPFSNIPEQNFYLKATPEQKNSEEGVFKLPVGAVTTDSLLKYLEEKAPKIKSYEKITNTDLFDVINLNKDKRESLEDFQVRNNVKDMYSSNGNAKIKKVHKSKAAILYEDDSFAVDHIADDDIRAATMSLGKWSDDDPSARTSKSGFIISKYTIATMFNIRSKYTISTPNYLANLPKDAEKYDSKEPLPEDDRVQERIEFIGNPEESINHKFKLNKY